MNKLIQCIFVKSRDYLIYDIQSLKKFSSNYIITNAWRELRICFLTKKRVYIHIFTISEFNYEWTYINTKCKFILLFQVTLRVLHIIKLFAKKMYCQVWFYLAYERLKCKLAEVKHLVCYQNTTKTMELKLTQRWLATIFFNNFLINSTSF